MIITDEDLQAHWDKRNRVVDPKSVAKPGLEKFAIAAKIVWSEYANTDPVIRDARAKYDSGLYEMFTGRSGDYLVLYLKPRRFRTSRHRPYFSKKRI